mgnify:CR=1 FL=1
MSEPPITPEPSPNVPSPSGRGLGRGSDVPSPPGRGSDVPSPPGRGLGRGSSPIPTDFDWLIYADATFAGLSLLLPIPFVDGLIETYFRRRMPGDIARRRGRALPMQSIRLANRQRGTLWPGCLLWPVQALVYLIRNLWRTLVYILTVYDTSEKLSYYWHRAFLLDYAIGRGDLDTPARAETAAVALHRVLDTTQTSPLLNLAREIVQEARSRIGALARALFRGARRQKTTEAKATANLLAARWAEFHDYLIELAGRYDATLAEVERAKAEELTQRR